MHHFQLKESGIGKYRTITTKQTVGRILDRAVSRRSMMLGVIICSLRDVDQSVGGNDRNDRRDRQKAETVTR
jgi:hypothetical protein